MGIDDELSQTKDFTTQVEGVAKTRYLSFLVVGVLEPVLEVPSQSRTMQQVYLTGFKFMLIELQIVQILRCPSA